MYLFFLFIGMFFVLFFIFSFLYFILPALSPVPFFPSNKKDLPMIVKTLLNNQHHDVIVDLGAGTGTVIFETARRAHQKKYDTHFIAIEINPLLILIMYIRRLFHPNKKNIRIIRTNMLEVDYDELANREVKQSALIFYLYIGHRVIEPLKKILENIKKDFIVVSYMYDVPGWKKYRTRIQKGIHTLTIYQHQSK